MRNRFLASALLLLASTACDDVEALGPDAGEVTVDAGTDGAAALVNPVAIAAPELPAAPSLTELTWASGQLGMVVEKLDLFQVMRKRLVITGSTMRPRTTAEKGAIAAQLRERVWPVLAAGRCGPLVHAVFPLAEAARAHALMESSAHVGKIVLWVAD